MNITKVSIFELNKDKLKAYATITIDEQFVVSGLKVLDSVNGYWVAYPNRKNSKPDDGTPNYKAYIDTAFPITKESRNEIQRAVLQAYKDFMESDNRVEPVVKPLEQNAEQKRYDSLDIDPDLLPF